MVPSKVENVLGRYDGAHFARELILGSELRPCRHARLDDIGRLGALPSYVNHSLVAHARPDCWSAVREVVHERLEDAITGAAARMPIGIPCVEVPHEADSECCRRPLSIAKPMVLALQPKGVQTICEAEIV